MPILLDARLIALHSQHSIQGRDLLKICALAKAEGMVADIDAYSFNDFLGLTIHLFVTTQSQHTREQLALQLPKFGSAIVLPLIKILCRIQAQEDIQALVQQSLDKIDLYPLIIGLNQVLDRENDKSLRTIAIQRFMKLIQENNQSLLLILPRLVSTKTWHLLKLQLLETMPYPRFNTGYGTPILTSQPVNIPAQDKQPCNKEKEHNNKAEFNLCEVK